MEHGSLTSISRTSIGNQVFEQLRNQIILGVWPPGTKIPSENALTKLLGVSRISIREALQKLAALELLESRQGEGTYVRQYSASMHMNSHFPILVLGKRDLIEVLEYRKIMEIGSIEIAVSRATQGDLEELERILEKMEADKDDESLFASDDLAFHMAIARATKNEVIIRVNTVISDIMSVSMEKIVHNLGIHDGLYYHRRILEAMKERNVGEAKAAMEEHVIRTIERIKELQKEA